MDLQVAMAIPAGGCLYSSKCAQKNESILSSRLVSLTNGNSLLKILRYHHNRPGLSALHQPARC